MMEDVKFFQVIVEIFKKTDLMEYRRRKTLKKQAKIFSWKKRSMIKWLILSPRFCLMQKY